MKKFCNYFFVSKNFRQLKEKRSLMNYSYSYYFFNFSKRCRKLHFKIFNEFLISTFEFARRIHDHLYFVFFVKFLVKLIFYKLFNYKNIVVDHHKGFKIFCQIIRDTFQCLKFWFKTSQILALTKQFLFVAGIFNSMLWMGFITELRFQLCTYKNWPADKLSNKTITQSSWFCDKIGYRLILADFNSIKQLINMITLSDTYCIKNEC